MYSLCEASTLQRTEQNYVLSSSRLPQYDRLASLGHKYGSAAEQRKATFTPVIATCEAIFDHEAEVYLKKISALLSSKWGTPYSQIHGWVKARMQVCILMSVSLCIRGSQTKWRGAGIEHGAQISAFLGSSY